MPRPEHHTGRCCRFLSEQERGLFSFRASNDTIEAPNRVCRALCRISFHLCAILDPDDRESLRPHQTNTQIPTRCILAPLASSPSSKAHSPGIATTLLFTRPKKFPPPVFKHARPPEAMSLVRASWPTTIVNLLIFFHRGHPPVTMTAGTLIIHFFRPTSCLLPRPHR